MIQVKDRNGVLIDTLHMLNMPLTAFYSVSTAYLPRYGQVTITDTITSDTQTFSHPYFSLVNATYFNMSTMTPLHLCDYDTCTPTRTLQVTALGYTFNVPCHTTSISVSSELTSEPLRNSLVDFNRKIFSPTVTEGGVEYYRYSKSTSTWSSILCVDDLDAATVLTKVFSCSTEFGINSSVDTGSTTAPFSIEFTNEYTHHRSLYKNNLTDLETCVGSSVLSNKSTKVPDLRRPQYESAYQQFISKSAIYPYVFSGTYDANSIPLFESNISLQDLAYSVVNTSTHTYVPTEVKFKYGDIYAKVTYDVYDLTDNDSSNSTKTFILS